MRQSLKTVVDMKAHRKLQRSAAGTIAEWNKLESSENAMALKVESFQVDPIYPEEGLPIRTQLKEIKGLAKTYHNPEYEKLVKTVVPLRTAFRYSKAE